MDRLECAVRFLSAIGMKHEAYTLINAAYNDGLINAGALETLKALADRIYERFE